MIPLYFHHSHDVVKPRVTNRHKQTDRQRDRSTVTHRRTLPARHRGWSHTADMSYLGRLHALCMSCGRGQAPPHRGC